MDGWLGICNTYSVNSYGNKLDSKNDHFGSGLFTNDVINLKHQGACQKLMIGWHKHQRGVRDPKKCRRHLWTVPNPIFEEAQVKKMWAILLLVTVLCCVTRLQCSVVCNYAAALLLAAKCKPVLFHCQWRYRDGAEASHYVYNILSITIEGKKVKNILWRKVAI